ncbi:hypothetical protein FTUN_2713 [Frigoriglobus tundricola]|uniref:Uncharacterized protein n=1 Tax=Frigoriglobus tundricola TaxID=2774151 RepID=A0A6M5YNU9_9BACT|nr:hypothetical protein FTUN_2713 [Frigoriglobus tundricola]
MARLLWARRGRRAAGAPAALVVGLGAVIGFVGLGAVIGFVGLRTAPVFFGTVRHNARRRLRDGRGRERHNVRRRLRDDRGREQRVRR